MCKNKKTDFIFHNKTKLKKIALKIRAIFYHSISANHSSNQSINYEKLFTNI